MSARLQNRRRFINDLRFLCRLVWLKLLLITYQIREKHFVRNQEYWNEDWNKSSNGEWTLQRINMGVLLSIWRREFRGIPFRNKFIIYMNFKPCPWRLFNISNCLLFLSQFISFQFRFLCHHSNALYRCFKYIKQNKWSELCLQASRTQSPRALRSAGGPRRHDHQATTRWPKNPRTLGTRLS